MEDQLEPCDEEEAVVEVKEESFDDSIIEGDKCEAEVDYTGASDAIAAVNDNDNESTIMDDGKQYTMTLVNIYLNLRLNVISVLYL